MRLWRTKAGPSLIIGALVAHPLSPALAQPARAAPASSARVVAPASPAALYGELFRAVQTMRIFPDGKTFVDATARCDPAAIMADYRRQAPRDAAALRAFVLANFTVPGVNDRQADDLRQHIRSL
jgi:alpha,alpha-trehalase